jgi:23S rRNA (cytidine1920-2'-O)/16S rRNA (cytidine1409-2'-O)-methyltransferase
VKRRLDAELVRRSLARSRQHAGELIGAGAVKVGGNVAVKAASQVDQTASIKVTTTDSGETAWASRGAHKLAGALASLSQRGAAPQIANLNCLDAGASTGGFTDVLLRQGAAVIHAVDVGYGQLDWRLQQDPRVKVRDRTNIRHLQAGDLDPMPQLVVADLSFISLRTVLPALTAVAAPNANYLLMVKPQFEVGRAKLPAGGVVTNSADQIEAIAAVAAAAVAAGLVALDVVRSPLPGPAGNVEFFIWLAGTDQGRPSPAERSAATTEAVLAADAANPAVHGAGAPGLSFGRPPLTGPELDSAIRREVLGAPN